jgi:DNA anti-recombination protein RmuC
MSDTSSNLLKLENLGKNFNLLLGQYQNIIKDLNYANATQLVSIKGSEVTGGTKLLSESRPSLEACRAICSSNTSCAGANYDTNTNTCVILSGDINWMTVNSSSNYSILSKLTQLNSINNQLTKILQQSSDLVKQIDTSYDTSQFLVQIANLRTQYSILEENKVELEKLISENNNLENEYNISGIMVNQSNLSYILWTVGALIVIIFAIRLFSQE